MKGEVGVDLERVIDKESIGTSLLRKLGTLERRFSLSCYRCSHTAVVVHRGKIVSWGRNSDKTHPIQEKFSKNPEAIYLHAEVDVSIRALRLLGRKRLSESVLVVARFLKDGTMGDSKPCSGCEKLLDKLKYRRVLYSTKGGWCERQS